jgi:DNA-binding PadR family transcriptional regulator
MLRNALLGFLSYKPMSGYDLENWINHSTGFFWHARLSQIYTTLKKLEEESMVVSHIETQEGRPDRRVYTITDAGLAELHAWVSEPLMETSPLKDDLLLRLFFSRPAGKDAILTMLHIQLKLHQQILTQYQQQIPQIIQRVTTELPELEYDRLLWETTLRFGVRREVMYLEWLGETIQRIQDEFPDER